jgi:hypothetical protein
MVKENIPKFQHFISQMQLKRFTAEDGRLYVFDKRVGKVLHSAPDNLFGQNHLYTTEDMDGEKDTALEVWFSSLESRASPVLDKIIAAARANRCPQLTTDEKQAWDLFFYMQWKRVPDVHRALASKAETDAIIDSSLQTLRKIYPDRLGEINELDTPIQRKRLAQGGLIRGIQIVGKAVLPALGQRGLAILKITASSENFAIGSLPVVRMRGNLNDPNVEAWLPIASDVAVGVGQERGKETLVGVHDPAVIQQFNRTTATQGTTFAARSRILIEGLVAFLQAR